MRWLLGPGYLSPHINRTMDSLPAEGKRSFIIADHSQGGHWPFLPLPICITSNITPCLNREFSIDVYC
jgi:hypothetical protein